MKIGFAALLAALLAGCVSGVPVSVTNQSATELIQVRVAGTGFAETISSIAPGATETISIRPKGESGLKVTFDAKGDRYAAVLDGTIANDDVNIVTVIVHDDFTIDLATQTR
jgi:hypothetical protein